MQPPSASRLGLCVGPRVRAGQSGRGPRWSAPSGASIRPRSSRGPHITCALSYRSSSSSLGASRTNQATSTSFGSPHHNPKKRNASLPAPRPPLYLDTVSFLSPSSPSQVLPGHESSYRCYRAPMRLIQVKSIPHCVAPKQRVAVTPHRPTQRRCRATSRL